MTWTLYHRWMWFWCWLCYRAYMALPMPYSHHTRYGRFNMWLLGYAGCYAHCDTRESFGECSFFRSSQRSSADRGGK